MRPLALLLLLVSGCSFSPDLSRFEPCGEGGACAVGFHCLAAENRCLPECVGDACPAPAAPPDSGTPDAGAPLALVTASLAPAIESTPYAQVVQAEGGVAPYTFHAVGPLPAGLALDAAGQLSGTPAVQGGSYPITVQVQDSGSPRASTQREWTLEVRTRLQLSGPGALARARVGSAYEEQLSSLGGEGPYRYALEPGSALPTGLSLSEGGAVTGTPAPAGEGSVQLTVRVTDAASPVPQTVTRALSLTVAPSVLLGPPLAVTTQSLPEARTGFPYHYQLHFEGGSSSTRWEIFNGPPPGLTFDLDTGVLSGTPSQASSFQMFVKLADGLSSTEQQPFTLEVR